MEKVGAHTRERASAFFSAKQPCLARRRRREAHKLFRREEEELRNAHSNFDGPLTDSHLLRRSCTYGEKRSIFHRRRRTCDHVRFVNKHFGKWV